MRHTLFVAHRIPGRLRMRLWREEPRDPRGFHAAAEALRGLREVARLGAHPVTSSLIVEYDPDAFEEAEVLESARRALGVERVVLPGEPAPPPTRMAVMTTRLARAVVLLVGELNADVYRASRGTTDLRVLLPLAFGAFGVAEIVVTRRLPAPPWFNLMWWSFRTFTQLNASAIAEVRGLDEAGATASPPPSPTRSPFA